jgi:Fur family transcriptional regulator, ferric uptake regulator
MKHAQSRSVPSQSHKQTGIRQTKGQQAVLEILGSSEHLLSAQEIYIALRDTEHPVGLATVYRAVEALVEEGKLQTLSLEGQAYYQVAQGTHSRHHLVCLQCKKVIPIAGCPVGELERQLSSQHAFAIDYHVLDFFGTCAQCDQPVTHL